MKISELQGILQKLAGIIGDAPIILKTIEGDAKTEIQKLGVEFSAAEDSGLGATVSVLHGTPTTPTVTPEQPANTGDGGTVLPPPAV